MFLLHKSIALDVGFRQWYLGGGLGPILEPKPASLPS